MNSFHLNQMCTARQVTTKVLALLVLCPVLPEQRSLRMTTAERQPCTIVIDQTWKRLAVEAFLPFPHLQLIVGVGEEGGGREECQNLLSN